MSVTKQLKDYIAKGLLGWAIVPRGLYESSEYFREYGGIDFKFEKKDDVIIAISQNFKCGTIITEGRNDKELDENIKDAIFTAFEIPSSYQKEANIARVGEIKKDIREYAIAK